MSGANGNLLIDDAVKIFSLPIICRRPSDSGFFNDVYFAHTLGYCFAGSTLMGQNAYLGLVPLLSNLISETTYIPSVSDVASQILAYLNATFSAYMPIGAQQSLFEIALFGYCHRNDGLEICHFRPQLVDQVWQMTLQTHSDVQERQFIYLGDDKAAMEAEIRASFDGGDAPGRPVSQMPRFVIEDRIANEEYPTIGGELQLASANRSGFSPLARMRPYQLGRPPAYATYLGREMTGALTSVGETRASLITLA